MAQTSCHSAECVKSLSAAHVPGKHVTEPKVAGVKAVSLQFRKQAVKWRVLSEHQIKARRIFGVFLLATRRPSSEILAETGYTAVGEQQHVQAMQRLLIKTSIAPCPPHGFALATKLLAF
jgi:hypothetical protein